MKAQLARMALLMIAFVIGVSSQLSAIGPTTRITIEGGNLPSPIVITDFAITNQFMVWAGAGTYSRSPQTGLQVGSQGFMIDWQAGPILERPSGLLRYKVSFYSLSRERGNETRAAGIEHLSYTVFYEYDPTTDRGFVYLPGKNDPEWTNNVSSIRRGVEGNWLRPSAAWEQAVKPILARETH
jgi:hypothetical protein